MKKERDDSRLLSLKITRIMNNTRQNKYCRDFQTVKKTCIMKSLNKIIKTDKACCIQRNRDIKKAQSKRHNKRNNVKQ